MDFRLLPEGGELKLQFSTKQHRTRKSLRELQEKKNRHFKGVSKPIDPKKLYYRYYARKNIHRNIHYKSYPLNVEEYSSIQDFIVARTAFEKEMLEVSELMKFQMEMEDEREWRDMGW